MLIFGYRHISSGYIRAAIAIILGLLLMIWPNWISYIIGGIILLIGVVSIVTAFYMRGMRTIVASLVSASITTVVGLLIIMHSDKFPEVIVFLLGILLAIFGLYQFFSLLVVRKLTHVPVYDFILSAVSAAAGFVMLAWPDKSSKFLLIFIGASIFVYGISTLLATMRIRMAMNEEEKQTFSPYEDVSGEKKDKEDKASRKEEPTENDV